MGVTVEGVPVELLAAEPERFGAALVRATGSPAYVAALEPLPDAPDEEAVYGALGLPWCPPELREEPFSSEPPALVALKDVRGDLHLPHDVVGWKGERRGDRARRSSARLRLPRNLRPHAGCGCRPGALWGRYPPPGALRNPRVRCLSHPTGRYIHRRPENALDLEQVFDVALEERVALEVNGLPDRLDLSGEHVREALRAGVRIVCSTDAHSVRGLENMALSVATARRGWATAADVVNTQPLSAILNQRRSAR